MNDLEVFDSAREKLPGLAGWLKNVLEVFGRIASFEDIERIFLLGNGLAKHTLRAYTQAVRDFHTWSGGMIPMQVTAAEIEGYYDNMRERKLSPETCALRIAALRKFFDGVKKQVPFAENPFDDMPEKLRKKLNRRTGRGKVKKVLTREEMSAILDYLEKDTSPDGLEKKALVLMLYTTGLRSFELLQLRHGDLEEREGRYFVEFTEKGGERAEQEIPDEETVRTVQEAFRARYGRKPRPEDPFFPVGSAGQPMQRTTLWNRLKELWGDLKNQGIVKRSNLEFSAHLFRRTCGSHMLEAGMDVMTVQKFLRHRNLTTTANHYLNVNQDPRPAFKKLLRR